MKTLSELFLVAVLMTFSSQDAVAQKIIKDSVEKQPVVNVFVENSPSMDGYVADGTFLKVLGNLITDVEASAKKVNLYIISDPRYDEVVGNSHLTQIMSKPQGMFSRDFQNSYSARKLGRSGKSQLDKILSYVVNNNRQGDVSIFLSDMIFSDNKVSPQDVLYRIFSKKDISMILYRFEGTFSGKYYYESPTKKKVEDIVTGKRPFFICVLSDNMKTLRDINQFESLKRKDLSSSSVLFTKEPIVFEEKKDCSRKDSKGHYNFTIKVNLAELPLDEGYVENIENYSTRRYFLQSIESDGFSESEKSHKLKLYTNVAPQHFVINLDKKKGDWIDKYSTIDDYPIDNNINKTYKLDELLSGLYLAYGFSDVANKPIPYATINCVVKQLDPPVPLPLKVLIGLLIASGGAVLIIFIRNKQYKS